MYTGIDQCSGAENPIDHVVAKYSVDLELRELEARRHQHHGARAHCPRPVLKSAPWESGPAAAAKDNTDTHTCTVLLWTWLWWVCKGINPPSAVATEETMLRNGF